MPSVSPSDSQGHGLEKSVWTDANYEEMGWHDCQLYAMALVQDEVDEYAQSVLIDLDYIVKWAGGSAPGDSYTFWISPATLIFHEVYDLRGDLAGGGYEINGFYTQAITRETAAGPSESDRWHVEADLGFAFRSTGFRQILRREPVNVPGQSLGLRDRGGLSFAESAFDGAPAERAITHPTSRRVARLLEDNQVVDGARCAATTPERLHKLDWELAHLRIGLLAFDIRQAELNAGSHRNPNSLHDEYLASSEFDALRRIGQDPLKTRDAMVDQLRNETTREAARYASREYRRLLNDIALLSAERSSLTPSDERDATE